jgi:uncharacterized protein YndB with AHSA1/START domain
MRRVFEAPRERVWRGIPRGRSSGAAGLHDPKCPGTEDFEVVTVVLTDLGDGRTEMLFEQRGSMSPEEYERATEGWGTFFDRLNERLTNA